MAVTCAPRMHHAAAGDAVGPQGSPQDAIADLVQVRAPACSARCTVHFLQASTELPCQVNGGDVASSGKKPWPGLHRSPEPLSSVLFQLH